MSVINNTYSAYESMKVSTSIKVKNDDKKTSQLSTAASEYLQKLKSQYTNMDFIVADFSSDEEAQELLAQGKGEYNCVITPETLEKMASNEEERIKFEGIIENAVTDLSDIKDKLGDDAERVKSFGISVDSEGNVSYYALLKEGLKKNESVEAAKKKATEKRAEKKEKAEKEEYEERLVKASTIEELLALIKGDSMKDEPKDRIEFGKNNDHLLKIDRVDFKGNNNEKIINDYVPVSSNDKVSPFDFKA